MVAFWLFLCQTFWWNKDFFFVKYSDETKFYCNNHRIAVKNEVFLFLDLSFNVSQKITEAIN